MTISPSDGCGFTPGPWTAHPYDGRAFFIHAAHMLAPRIATVSYTDGAHSFHEANARLIAASPTMYAYIERKANEGDGEAAAIVEAINAGLSTSKHSRLHNLARGGE